MAVSPPEVELNGVGYKLYTAADVDNYREYAEPKLVQEPDVAGASRPSKNTRPDIPVWRWDSWSGGEGQEVIDSQDPESFRKYFYTTGAVDVLTEGEISLGLGVVESYASGATTYHQGPYLVLTRYDATLNPHNIGFLVNQKVFMHQDTGAGVYDSWADMGNAAADAGNRIAGPARYFGGYIYAAYKDGSGAASSSRVRRITAADPDVANITTSPNAAATVGTATQTNSENAIPANNRLHVLKDATGQLNLYRSDLNATLPGTMDAVYAVKGAGSEAGVAALSNRIHVASQYVNEEPRIHIYDGDRGAERLIMPEGFRMDTTPYDSLAFLGDILYIAGYELFENGSEIGAVGWVAPGRTGSWRVRESTEVPGDDTPGRFTVALPLVGNRIVFATGQPSGFWDLMIYDAALGGLSQFVAMPVTGSSARITSLRLLEGLLWIGVHFASAAGTAGEVRIYRTVRPGNTGHYDSSSVVHSSFYDFGYREEFKTIRKVTVECAPLDVGTKITLTLVDEVGNAYTTDKNGDDLVVEGADVTSKTFFISGLDDNKNAVERVAKALRIQMELETSNTAVTPTVRAVVTEADIHGYSYFYDVVLALQDMESYERIFDREVSGEEQMENIRKITRLEDGNKRVISFDPRYVVGGEGGAFPEEGVTTRYPVPVKIVDFDLRGLTKANAFVKLRLQEYS